ncbi:hypothetical protein FB45DRAFT_120867 [Roridomyces roridus]|uniref:Uncharacterized protein n=1 Tax=Roridomyces roridus TaxID=1738132 RepID=A0AAD7F850_9AGAR|nr:hypothetical protein FB45DRAFT_120867 [Roridomyces roridus]
MAGMSSIPTSARPMHVSRHFNLLPPCPAPLALNSFGIVGRVSDAGDIARVQAHSCCLQRRLRLLTLRRNAAIHGKLHVADSSAKTSSVNTCARFLCPSLQSLPCGRRPSILQSSDTLQRSPTRPVMHDAPRSPVLGIGTSRAPSRKIDAVPAFLRSRSRMDSTKRQSST